MCVCTTGSKLRTALSFFGSDYSDKFLIWDSDIIHKGVQGDGKFKFTQTLTRGYTSPVFLCPGDSYKELPGNLPPTTPMSMAGQCPFSFLRGPEFPS